MKVNELYCGDALELIEQVKTPPNLIVLHPPDFGKDFVPEDYSKFLKKVYSKCLDKLNDNGVLVSVTTDRRYNGSIYPKHSIIYDIMNSFGAINIDHKIWVKSLKANLFIPTFAHILCFKKYSKSKITNHRSADYLADVWVLDRDPVNGYSTKDTFPSDLVKKIILNFTNENDLVLDPFVGSGKTAKVAKDLNRQYIGFELNSDNFNIACKYVG